MPCNLSDIDMERKVDSINEKDLNNKIGDDDFKSQQINTSISELKKQQKEIKEQQQIKIKILSHKNKIREYQEKVLALEAKLH